MRTVLTDGGPGTEFWREFESFQQSAWRWEQQPQYHLGYERLQFDLFLAGTPESPLDNDELGAWMRQVAGHVAAGRTVGRVRVVESPPTDYQRWMQWMDRWNREAGEDIRYLTRQAARAASIIPAIGDTDWWLFDDRRLVLMHHDSEGRRVKAEALEDEPEVEQAIRWRALAVAAANREAAAVEH